MKAPQVFPDPCGPASPGDREAALCRERIAPAQPCVVRFPAALTVEPGQSHPHVRLAKAMLAALGGLFPAFEPCGPDAVLDAPTARNLRLLQQAALLPETGMLDKPTWNRLCQLYRAEFDRYHPPAQG